MSFSIKQLRLFIIIRRTLVAFLKIFISLITIILIAIFALMLLLSAKPRSVKELNEFIKNRIEKNSEILKDFKFDTDKATLFLNRRVILEYKINNIEANINDYNFKLSSIIIGVKFFPLLLGVVDVNKISLLGSEFEIDISDKVTKDPTKFNLKKTINAINNRISQLAASNHKIPEELIFNDFIIRLKNEEVVNQLNVTYSNFKLGLGNNDLIVNTSAQFVMNNNEIPIKLKAICKRTIENNKCDISFNNFNPLGFKTTFSNNSILTNYTSNVNAFMDGKINLTFDKKIDIDNGTFEINSTSGYFDLKEFFDEKIDFKELKIKGGFTDGLKNIFIDSLKTNFDETKFEMSLFLKFGDKYNNLDLNFDMENLPLKDLKKLWPNFLGQKEEIRPWVVEHITDGYSKKAWAKMNIRYFPHRSKKRSKLKKIEAEVSIDNAFLNYDDDFPPVSNINGLAKFTKNDMIINLKSGNILDSKASDVVLKTNFRDKNKTLSIEGNATGPFSDLFVHINYKDKLNIENNVNRIIEDYYTKSVINIVFPYNDLDFEKTHINIIGDLYNKKGGILKNETTIPITFVKEENSNNFYGILNLTNSDIEFIPINFNKSQGESLVLNYNCSIEDNIIRVNKISSSSNNITMVVNGFFNTDSHEQLLNFKNVTYNGSSFDAMYNFKHLTNNKTSLNIKINGENLVFNNILKKLSSLENSDKNPNHINFLTIKASLDNITLDNNNKLSNTVLDLNFVDKNLQEGNFSANLPDKKVLLIGTCSKNNNKTINIFSDNYGEILNLLDVTDKLVGGTGHIIMENSDILNKKSMAGSLNIEKFIVVTDNNLNREVLEKIGEDNNFRKLRKILSGKNSNSLSFNRIRGEFLYSDKILNLKNIAADSSVIGLDILASGFINLMTENTNIKGLIFPVGIINSLFGISDIPVLGDIIFGQKGAGLFASKFSVTKKNANSKLNININKFSMILPGFLRNIF